MGAGFLISLGVAVGIYAADYHLCHRKYLKKLDKERRERLNRIEYNKTHLPSKELPPLSPDSDKLGKVVIKSSGLMLKDVGDSYVCIVVYASENYKQRSISKSELDGDTIKLIDLLLKDLDWFYAHPTGVSVGECGTVLESFLREKYPMLSADSVSRICNRYCVNDR